jgi:nucleotide-binding universal stress UspA family protein
MNCKRILVPLDLRRSPTDALRYLQQCALETPFSATFLHVVELNIAPHHRRVYEEICAESRAALRKLSRLFLGHEDAARVRVRMGRADEQILAEACSSGAELIILSRGKPRLWRPFFRSRTVERVVQAAPCPALVLPGSWKIEKFHPSARAEGASPTPVFAVRSPRCA